MKLRAVIFFIFITGISAFAQNIEVAIPKEIDYRGQNYIYDSGLNSGEMIIKGNLDQSPGDEILISFGTYDISDKNKKEPVYFFQIYKISSGNKYLPVRTIKCDSTIEKVMLKDFNRDGIGEIILLSQRKSHYRHIYIYQWQKEDFNLIWDRGSYCGIEVDFDAEKPIIKVASSNFGAKIKNNRGEEVYWCYAAEPLWETYNWDGQTFTYRKDLSTTFPLSKLR